MRSLLFIVITICFASNVIAQTSAVNTDDIPGKLLWYSMKHNTTSLFVHFDKNVYTTNEEAWFTGYIIKNNTGRKPTAMSVCLVNNINKSIVCETKFVVKGRFSFGSIFIPDSLHTGDYSFVCFTDVVVDSLPTDVFIQPITVQSSLKKNIITNVTLQENKSGKQDSLNVLLRAYTQDVSLVKNALVRYKFLNDRDFNITKTNNFGEATLTFASNKVTAVNNTVVAEIISNIETKQVALQLPVKKQNASVRFFPEGGSLVENVSSVVGWEAKDADGSSLLTSAELLENNKKIASVETDAYGLGRFTLEPKPGMNYRVNLLHAQGASDTTYALPPSRKEGAVINVQQALVGDTLIIRLLDKSVGEKYQLLVHNYNEVFATINVTSRRGPVTIKVAVDQIPKGLAALTLLNSNGMPLAERMFFANYNYHPNVQLQTDSSIYGTRQKVEMDLAFKDDKGDPLLAVVSIACAKDDCFDVKKMTDIESYSYLRHELEDFQFKNRFTSDSNDLKKFMEDILLVKGWRQYKWESVVRTTVNDTLQKFVDMIYTGAAVKVKKQITKPVNIQLMRKKYSVMTTTDSVGRFMLTPADVIFQPEDLFRIVVKDETQDQYRIKVDDPYSLINKRVVDDTSFKIYNATVIDKSNQTVVIKSLNNGNRMLDVKVVQAKNHYAVTNECGDYVCEANVLNCPNHTSGGRMPIVGERYKTGRGSLVYQGCAGMKYLKMIEGIYMPKDFYTADEIANDPKRSGNSTHLLESWSTKRFNRQSSCNFFN